MQSIIPYSELNFYIHNIYHTHTQSFTHSRIFSYSLSLIGIRKPEASVIDGMFPQPNKAII